MAKTWKEFEDLVGKETKRLYPQSAGWRVEPQKPLKGDKYRVDYVVYKGSEHYVIEAKQVEELEKSQVDQVIECKRVFNASKGFICITPDAKVYPPLKIYAAAQDIEILYLSSDP